MRFIGLSDKKSKPAGNRLREIGNDGSGVFVDYEKEKEELNRPKKITDFRNMMRDGTVEALFNILTMPILASEYNILPADESEAAKAQADFVRRNLLSENYRGGMETPFDLFLDQSMMALIDGFQVWEKVYKLNGERYELKKLALRDSRSIEIMKDAKGGYQGVKQQQENGTYVEIPAYKTFLFTHGKRYDAYYGRSVFTALWRNYDKKWKLEYLDSIALQNDAIKPKILKNTGGAVLQPNNSVVSKALRTLSRLGKINSVASIPENYEVEVLNSDGRDPHQSIERQNSEMARVFLANFMLLGSQGTSSTGSFALSATQAKMFRMSLESILDKLASHINQYLIADLIDINFATPYYPVFKFEKLDDDVVNAVFNAFTTLAQKDRVSDAMAEEIEDATAAKLGFDVEKIKQRRAEAAEAATAGDEKAELSDKGDKSVELSDKKPEEARSEDLERLGGKWQELEDRFLAQIRPVYEDVAEELAGKVAAAKTIGDIDDVVLPVEYRRTLVSFFKQGYQLGKISASDELGKPAPKTSSALTKAAVEYISWIIDKQQADLTNYAKELVMTQVVLADEEMDYKSRVEELLATWFVTKLLLTATLLIGIAINSGRGSVFDPEDLVEYSAIIDNKTTARCKALDGKIMKWKDWLANPDLHPQKHFNCRSAWVKVDESKADSQTKPPDRTQIERIDHIQKTPKPQLIEENPLLKKYTKDELLSIEVYKGNGYININQVLLGARPTNQYAEIDIKRLDKAIKKTVLEKDTTLWRGIGMKRQLKLGDYIDHPNYTSTSYDIKSALGFSQNADWNKYLLEFRAPKGMPYLDTEKVLDAGGLTTLVEHEYLLSRGKKFVVKSIKEWDNGIQKVIVEMTDDTKYLSDNSSDELSPEERRQLDEAWAKLEADRKAGKEPSRVVKRLHHIWQMESDYFNNNPDAIKSADEAEK